MIRFPELGRNGSRPRVPSFAGCPRSFRPATVIGQVSSAAVQRFGVPAGAVVVTGATDGCAAFLATGADKPGDAVTSLGSTLVLKLASEQPLFAPEYGIYSHRIGNLWLAGGASNTGGAVLAQFFTADEIRDTSARIDTKSPTGLDYYPLPSRGERFPINDPMLEPRMTPRPADATVFLQALLKASRRSKRSATGVWPNWAGRG